MHFLAYPRADAAPEELGRWNGGTVHHHQDFHEEAAERHVAHPAVQVCREREEGGEQGVRVHPF